MMKNQKEQDQKKKSSSKSQKSISPTSTKNGKLRSTPTEELNGKSRSTPTEELNGNSIEKKKTKKSLVAKSLPASPAISDRKTRESKLNRSHSVDDFQNGISGPPMMQLSLEDD